VLSSITAWLTDQITEAIRPIATQVTTDILRRARIDVTIRITLEEDHRG